MHTSPFGRGGETFFPAEREEKTVGEAFITQERLKETLPAPWNQARME